MRRAASIVLGVILAGFILPSAAVAAKRVALVIGISDYQSLTKLTNPVPDARAISSALKSHGFEVTERYDLPRADFLDVLESFASVAEQSDVALVYYAGHGMEMAGKNVLAPKDMEIDCDKKAPRRALDLDLLFTAVEGAPQQIVLLDACRNDPFPQCPKRSVGGGGGFRGFTRVSADDNSLLIANSTLGGQLADDGKPGLHSPFASALLTHFSAAPGSYFRDLLEEVARDVKRASKGAQVPEILTRGGAVRVCLDETKCGVTLAAAALSPSPAPAPISTTPDPTTERRRLGEFAYLDCVRANSLDCYKKFLGDFSDHPRAVQVEKIISSQTETALYQSCATSNAPSDRIAACQGYLNAFPDGQYTAHAKDLLRQAQEAIRVATAPTPPPPPPVQRDETHEVNVNPRAELPRPRSSGERCGQSGEGLYCASSVLKPQMGNYYGPENAFDDNSATAWVEGRKGQGIGESITLEFDAPRTVHGLTVRNGYGKNADIYAKNSRVRGIEVRFSDGSIEEASLADRSGAQTIDFGRPVKTKWVQIKILSVYPGWKYSDTAINEIRVN